MRDRPRRRKPWSAHEVAELTAMAAKGPNKQQIALALGRTLASVEVKLWKIAGGQAGESAPTRKANQRRKAGASFFLS